MNISYNWLKEYVNFDLTPDETAAALTSIGLETGGVEEVQTIKGGLEGLVIGEVLTCTEHPNSDHLHITTVNLGDGEPVLDAPWPVDHLRRRAEDRHPYRQPPDPAGAVRAHGLCG